MSKQIIFDVDDDKFAELEQIMRECGFEDWRSYFNSEMTLLKCAFRAIKKGKTVVILDEVNSKIEKIKMEWMERIQSVRPLKLV